MVPPGTMEIKLRDVAPSQRGWSPLKTQLESPVVGPTQGSQKLPRSEDERSPSDQMARITSNQEELCKKLELITRAIIKKITEKGLTQGPSVFRRHGIGK